jgi:hypothetical protein
VTDAAEQCTDEVGEEAELASAGADRAGTLEPVHGGAVAFF